MSKFQSKWEKRVAYAQVPKEEARRYAQDF